MEYQKEYGWGMHRKPADLSRCAKSVANSTGWGSFQCQRKARYDPDEYGKPTTCKQHSHDAVKARHEKQIKKDEARNRVWKRRHAAPALERALREIANGHNDPRARAREALKNLDD